MLPLCQGFYPPTLVSGELGQWAGPSRGKRAEVSIGATIRARLSLCLALAVTRVLWSSCNGGVCCLGHRLHTYCWCNFILCCDFIHSHVVHNHISWSVFVSHAYLSYTVCVHVCLCVCVGVDSRTNLVINIVYFVHENTLLGNL